MAEPATVTYLHERHVRDPLERLYGFWWSNCIGYHVVADHGELGVVLALEQTVGAPAPDLLVVGSGPLRRHPRRIPVEDVAFADPCQKRLHLAGRYRLLAG